ncbi:hypothetical protein ACFQ3N_15815 [Virgibacillus byunsanensis]|uniref:Uncharacterized protein n=1 Tax=Virgibacillus byunsanensis TaxID=570945 RepID=A0ABW3LSK9_9BACI
MEQHFLSVEEFNELLKNWNGQNITITKHEMDDIDETQMKLEAISYDRDTRRIDDYEPMHSLHLNGTGHILSETNNPQSLPSSLYEIPLEDSTMYEFDGSEFLLSTSRGVYKIRLQI